MSPCRDCARAGLATAVCSSSTQWHRSKESEFFGLLLAKGLGEGKVALDNVKKIMISIPRLNVL